MTILLISSSPLLMEQVETELATRMPTVRVIGKCYTLRDGIRAAQALLPGVVLLDGDMDGVAGMGDMEMLITKGSVLIVLVSKGTPLSSEKAIAMYILEKPFDVEAFAELMDSC